MSTLQGRVAIVTGASRGIGRALALGLAKAGCHVVIAAKSTTSTEKLPGSIFTVAAEVEALGAQALPVQVDLRDEQQIENLAAKTRERFGRIDLLINNAGALYWNSLLETPAKRFDLVMSVNARAAFLCCRAVSAGHDRTTLGPHHQHESAARSLDGSRPYRLRHLETRHDPVCPSVWRRKCGATISPSIRCGR